MSVLPQTIIEQIEFCEAHLPVWGEVFTQIGLTSAQVTAFSPKVSAARGAYNAALAAREASKAATTEMRDDAAQMRRNVSDLIRTIKAYAEQQANPNAVYALAQIPPPSLPTPLPVPGRPTNIEVTLLPSGAITLSWDAINAAASSGAFYNIYRKLPGQTSFTGIGGAPGTTSTARRMNFTDSSIPTSAAANGAQYVIQGQRGTQVGEPCDAITVQFGVDGGGGFSAVGAKATDLKMAA
jgi:hypothetical protein